MESTGTGANSDLVSVTLEVGVEVLRHEPPAVLLGDGDPGLGEDEQGRDEQNWC